MPKAKTSKSNTKSKVAKGRKRHRTAYMIFSSEKRSQVKVISFIKIFSS